MPNKNPMIRSKIFRQPTKLIFAKSFCDVPPLSGRQKFPQMGIDMNGTAASISGVQASSYHTIVECSESTFPVVSQVLLQRAMSMIRTEWPLRLGCGFVNLYSGFFLLTDPIRYYKYVPD